MRLELHSKGIELTRGLQSFVETKLRHAMGRFAPTVRSIRITLSDVNGRRGGEDIHCRIRADLGSAGTVTINETREDPYAAVSRASGRASRNVAKGLSRLKAGRKGR